MVWVNNKHYNAKSYPYEAYGGAMCTCAACKQLRKDMGRLDREKTRLQDELIRLVDGLIDENVMAAFDRNVANG